jgi:hypothetical protein
MVNPDACWCVTGKRLVKRSVGVWGLLPHVFYPVPANANEREAVALPASLLEQWQ